MAVTRQKQDLSFEPALAEVLDDPVVRAVMVCDGVSVEDIIHLIVSTRLRLAKQQREAVVMPFPARPARENQPRDPWPPGSPADASCAAELRRLPRRSAPGVKE